MKYIAAFAATLYAVEAGFCDYGSSYSGWRCDDDVSKYCSCKRKSGKTKCDKTQENWCSYGCWGGRCQLPPTPAPADEVCADSTLTDFDVVIGPKATVDDPNPVQETKYLSEFCPDVMASGYKTWKDIQQAPESVNKAKLALAVEDYVWWDDLRMRMVETNATVYNSTADLPPKVRDAWTSFCDESNQEQGCRRMFPECKNDAGYNTKCVEVCRGLDTCVTNIQNACFDLAKTDDTIACKTYRDFFAEYLNDDDTRKCEDICATYQNDYASGAAVPLASSVALLGALATALLL